MRPAAQRWKLTVKVLSEWRTALPMVPALESLICSLLQGSDRDERSSGETARNTHRQETKENNAENSTKEQDVKHRTKDTTNNENEVAAVNEYL